MGWQFAATEYEWDAETFVSSPEELEAWIGRQYKDAGEYEYMAVDVWIPEERSWCVVTPGAQSGLVRKVARKAFAVAYAFGALYQKSERSVSIWS